MTNQTIILLVVVSFSLDSLSFDDCHALYCHSMTICTTRSNTLLPHTLHTPDHSTSFHIQKQTRAFHSFWTNLILPDSPKTLSMFAMSSGEPFRSSLASLVSVRSNSQLVKCHVESVVCILCHLPLCRVLCVRAWKKGTVLPFSSQLPILIQIGDAHLAARKLDDIVVDWGLPSSPPSPFPQPSHVPRPHAHQLDVSLYLGGNNTIGCILATIKTLINSAYSLTNAFLHHILVINRRSRGGFPGLEALSGH